MKEFGVNKWKLISIILLVIILAFGIWASVRAAKNFHNRVLAQGVKTGYYLTVRGILNQLKTNGYVTILIKQNNSSKKLILIPYGGGNATK